MADKKIVETYTCEACGRQKVIRFKPGSVTTASYGMCPRCGTGVMLSSFITRMIHSDDATLKAEGIDDPETFRKNVMNLTTTVKFTSKYRKQLKKGKKVKFK